MKHFFHIYANGSDARNFILSEKDFTIAFNRVGVCAANCKVKVLSFSIEDSHPHILIYAEYEDAMVFKAMYESSSMQYIRATRGSSEDVIFILQIDQITDESYLRNVGTYSIVQPTKDGRHIMPYDYLYGTGSLYFRSNRHVPIWYFDSDGRIATPVSFGSLSKRAQREYTHSRLSIPDEWLVCNGFILPYNYIDVESFQSIYKTHNCFRTFLSAGKKRTEEVEERMAELTGISLEDLEARNICKEVCRSLFSIDTSRYLNVNQRLTLARELRRQYRISFRQLATLCRLPEAEIRKYVR